MEMVIATINEYDTLAQSVIRFDDSKPYLINIVQKGSPSFETFYSVQLHLIEYKYQVEICRMKNPKKATKTVETIKNAIQSHNCVVTVYTEKDLTE
jgi:hypothetical protein